MQTCGKENWISNSQKLTRVPTLGSALTRQSKHSDIAKAVLSKGAAMAPATTNTAAPVGLTNINHLTDREASNTKATQINDHLAPPPKPQARVSNMANQPYENGFGIALSDTPMASAPPSPRL